MSEIFDLPNLILLGVAIIVLLRLKSVLGTRTGNEKKPFDPYRAKPEDKKQEAPVKSADADNVIDLPINEKVEKEVPVWEGIAKKGSALAKSLEKIKEADAGFDAGDFIEGSKTAYEMILNAFANGDKSTLKKLLSDDVYESFVEVIEERIERKEVVQSDFVGLKRAEIKKAALKENNAQVTMNFACDLISVTYSEDNEVVDGDPKKVNEVIDVWTFSRDVTSKNPNWKLIATQGE